MRSIAGVLLATLALASTASATTPLPAACQDALTQFGSSSRTAVSQLQQAEANQDWAGACAAMHEIDQLLAPVIGACTAAAMSASNIGSLQQQEQAVCRMAESRQVSEPPHRTQPSLARRH